MKPHLLVALVLGASLLAGCELLWDADALVPPTPDAGATTTGDAAAVAAPDAAHAGLDAAQPPFDAGAQPGPDAGAEPGPDAGCVPLTGEALCLEAGVECGNTTLADDCSGPRSVSCGGCMALQQTCSTAGASVNTCTCAQCNTGQSCDPAWQACVYDSWGWQHTLLDQGASRNVGRATSVAVDTSQGVHVAYVDDTVFDDPQLRYAWRTAQGSVGSEFVDSYSGETTSLRVDAVGEPHIAYCGLADHTSGALKYASHETGAWSPEFVDVPPTNGFAGVYSSLAFDAQARPAIAYSFYDGNAFALRYAWKDGGTWKKDDVDAAGNVGAYASLAFDGQGRAHLAYYDSSNQALKYAHGLPGSWTLETVDTGDAGKYCVIALDAHGLPHIAYSQVRGGDRFLRHAHWSGARWMVEDVENMGYTASQFALAIDAADKPHLAYSVTPTGVETTLHYARRVGNAFAISVVDGYRAGSYSSLFLRGGVHPVISYCDEQGKALELARWAAP